jgi:hypothetical protein
MGREAAAVRLSDEGHHLLLEFYQNFAKEILP